MIEISNINLKYKNTNYCKVLMELLDFKKSYSPSPETL